MRWNGWSRCDIRTVTTMAGTKRKSSNAVSAIAQRQAASTYSLATRTRRSSLKGIDAKKLQLALSTCPSVGWELTSNPKVVSKVDAKGGKEVFRCQVNKRGRPSDRKAVRKRGTILYTTVLDAEKHLYEFRLSCESQNSRKQIEAALNGEDDLILLEDDEANKKAKVVTNVSKACLQAQSMSSGNAVRLRGKPNRNPHNSASLSNLTSKEISGMMAQRIQKAVRGRGARRSALAHANLMQDQNYRLTLKNQLAKRLRADQPWSQLLLGADDDETAQSYSEYEKRHVVVKARHIFRAVKAMYEFVEAGIPMSWKECCEMAIKDELSKYSALTVMTWYRELTQSQSLKFRRNLRGRASDAARSPFNEDEGMMMQLKGWGRANLEKLSVDSAREWINETMLSKFTAEQFTNLNISYPVSPHIASRWLREAGFRYEAHRKSYYVDRHEAPNVVHTRKKYVGRCFKLELREYSWVQLPKVEYERRKRAKKAKERAKKVKKPKEETKKSKADEHPEINVDNYVESMVHEYKNEKGEEYVEIHVDMLTDYEETDDDYYLRDLPFGGNLSVRKPPHLKPLVVFGQDEAIYRSTSLCPHTWTIDGQSPLRTKGSGRAVMVSAIMSREFGFGFKLTLQELAAINLLRTEKQYADEESATALFGNAKKPKLTESPFIRTLEIGIRKDGYWTYKHMVVQLEDCVDCFRFICDKRGWDFDIGFELDHSSGHAHTRPNGLSINELRLGWGGKQKPMRDSVLTAQDVGSFDHDRRVQVGETQSMVFQLGDNPPIDSPNAPASDTVDGEIEKFYDVNELRAILQEKGLESTGKKTALEQRCKNADLPLKRKVPKITPGYIGSAKGGKQIAFERGFFDATCKMDGVEVSWEGDLIKDAEGKQVLDKRGKKARNTVRSVRGMLGGCADFANEKTLLQHVLEDKLACLCMLTPKCHPEIAGRGIEYAWGYSKLRYRNHFNDAKQNHLEANVSKALSTDVLTLNRMRKFARKAREYKLTYSFLAANEKEDGDMSKGLIDHITRQFKQHRSALDTNYAFIVNS
jgi:hypothetical protein